MTNKQTKTKSDQSERFIEAARELGCDEDEKSFDQKLKKVASASPAKARKGKAKKS